MVIYEYLTRLRAISERMTRFFTQKALIIKNAAFTVATQSEREMTNFILCEPNS